MTARGTRTLTALALQLAALATLALALVGRSWLDERSKPRLLVLVDRSQSMPRSGSDQALAEVLHAGRDAGAGELRLIEFAGRPAAPAPPGSGAGVDLQSALTDIESALQAALVAHAGAAFDAAVIISDGLANRGDTARALHALREARLPLQWRALGRPPPPVRVAEVLAPERVQVGQRVRVAVQLAGPADKPLHVKAVARSVGGQTQSARAQADPAGRATLEFDASRSGAVVVDVTLLDAVSGQTLHEVVDAAVIDIAPAAAVLYAQGSAGNTLARSLLAGGWSVQVTSAARLDAHADSLDGYQAVVLDDVAIDDASPRLWAALVAAVKQRGLGLVVLGGERSFARGGYRGSVLETVLPVVSEPAVLDEPASIVFAVDKSGSMGQGSAGVDRFQLAQRAVLETARGLPERDALGLLVFDVAPRVLIPLGSVAAGSLALARPWPVSPNGGTRLAPALEAALVELERAGRGRRLLVLVTDGYVDDAPLADLRARLVRSRIETLALAVGPDADVAALQRLLGEPGALVLRVNEAAELPRVMRAGLERQRARVERGRIDVEQALPLPFAPGLLQDWPPVTAHAVTRPQPGAVVAVATRRGEPLIAFHGVGRGRVIALTSGLGPWAGPWLSWAEWPRLAGGLAGWASGTGPRGALAMTVKDSPAGLQVELELPAGQQLPDTARVSLAVDTPTQTGQVLSLQAVAPGRLRATLPDSDPGLYTFIATTAGGSQRQLHLRRQHAENQAWGTNPALDTWRADGLVSAWDPRAPLPKQPGQRTPRAPDRSLIALALTLFLIGVLMDRTVLRLAGLGAAWQRARQRIGWRRAGGRRD